MNQAVHEELVDAIYQAALDPSAWLDVTRLLGRAYPSNAQTFYFLDRSSRQVRPVCLNGVAPDAVRSFDELYFAPDNPWIRVTSDLHRLGVVRTTQRLEQHLRERGVLSRSAYYKEWMRPQGFEHNIGNTLLADGDIVANITLFRPPDMPAFDDGEVQSFETLSRHMTRALRMSQQLERGESCPTGSAALDALPKPVALIDARRRLRYVNEAMEHLLAARRGLCTSGGELMAIDADAQQCLVAHVAAAAASAAADVVDDVAVPAGPQHRLSLRAVPVRGSLARLMPARSALLVIAEEFPAAAAVSSSSIRQLYGCTPREAALARILCEGRSLKHAAAAMNISYGTARQYLNIVFQKTGVHSQAQLVRRLLGSQQGGLGSGAQSS